MKKGPRRAYRHANVALIEEHDTWVSVDPLVGCPASCDYCYLGPLNLAGREPEIRVSPLLLIEKLSAFLRQRIPRLNDRVQPIPLCMGNYTDMFLSQQGIDYLRAYIPLHATHFPNHPLCLITKARLRAETVAELDAVGHPILFFLSQSFFLEAGSRVEKGPVSKVQDTLDNFSLLARSQHIIPLHFWRPVTLKNVPSLSAAVHQLERIHEAGALASIAIGLKWGPGMRDVRGTSTLVDDPSVLHDGENLPENLRRWFHQAGAKTGHPVFRHTSCAIALALRRAEALGTWRAPIRQTMCEPCSCPSVQRARCDAAREDDVAPGLPVLEGIASRLQIPKDLVTWSKDENCISIGAEVTQNRHAELIHQTGFRISVNKYRLHLAWPGSILHAKSEKNKDMNRADSMVETEDFSWRRTYPRLCALLDRLEGITGFVSVLGNDPRVEVYRRSHHLNRVSQVTRWLCDQFPMVDRQVALLIAECHDINRLPFAHNLEKAIRFDQAQNLASYLEDHDVYLYPEIVQSMVSMLSKDTNGSPEARLVFAADVVTGFLEDPLLAMSTLGFSLSSIPTDVANKLGLLSDEALHARINELNYLFHHRPSAFPALLGETVLIYATTFLERYNTGNQLFIETPIFPSINQELKESFLRAQLFPINNERVSQGKRLSQEVGIPLMASFKADGLDPIKVLLDMTDQQALIAAFERGLIQRFEEYYPCLPEY